VPGIEKIAGLLNPLHSVVLDVDAAKMLAKPRGEDCATRDITQADAKILDYLNNSLHGSSPGFKHFISLDGHGLVEKLSGNSDVWLVTASAMSLH
jgi:hypothetical protein